MSKAVAETTKVPETEAPVEPLDLRGQWVQQEHNADSYMVAEIRDDGKIGVFFYAEGDTPWTYWIGTYEAPEKDTDNYSWTSVSTYTGSGLLASTDSEKKFTYEKGILKFPITIQDKSGELYLVREEWDNSAIPAEVYGGAVTSEDIKAELSNAKQEQKDSPYYFKDMEVVAKDYSITITDWKVIEPGKEGNKYGKAPVIAFWYDTTNTSGKEIDPMSAWIYIMTAVQDNDPNAINKLNAASHPDSKYLDNQLAKIKQGGTVTNAFAYELTDTTTPVELTAKADMLGDDIGAMTFDIVSGEMTNGASASIGTATAENTGKVSPSFSNNVIVTKDYTIEITDYKVIPVGKEGNEHGDSPVIAFWYNTTNTSGKEIDPSSAWIYIMTAIQDNDPNMVKKLDVALLPDSRFLDSQLAKIKAGGTVENAVAYKLTDTETPVELTAKESMLGPEIGTQIYSLDGSGPESQTAASSHATQKMVIDDAGLFSDEQIQNLTREIDELRAHTGMDAVVLTTPAKNGKSTENFAREFYVNGKFGVGEGHSGFLYMIDMEDMVTQLITAGGAVSIFSDANMDKTMDNAYAYLEKGDFAGSVSAVLSDFVGWYDEAINQGLKYNVDSGKWSN